MYHAYIFLEAKAQLFISYYFYFASGPCTPRVPLRGLGRRSRTRGGRRGRGRAHSCGQLCGVAGPVLHESYHDEDQGNPQLPFTPMRLAGIHFG